MKFLSCSNAVRLASLLLVASVADAQERLIPENVTARTRASADAKGLPLGAFRAYPKLGILGGYDSNILSTDSDVLRAGRTTVAPSVLVESQWSRHSLSFGSFLESRLYPYESKQNYLNWGFGSTGRFDLLDTTKPTAGKAIEALLKVGVLGEITGKKRDRVYAYQSYLDILSAENVSAMP